MCDLNVICTQMTPPIILYTIMFKMINSKHDDVTIKTVFSHDDKLMTNFIITNHDKLSAIVQLLFSLKCISIIHTLYCIIFGFWYSIGGLSCFRVSDFPKSNLICGLILTCKMLLHVTTNKFCVYI